MAYFAGHKRKTKSLQTVRYDCILVFHTHTQMFYGSPNFLRDNPGEPVPEETFTHSYLSCHQLSLNCFLHLPRSMASSLFSQCAWQSFFTISFKVFFGLSLGLAPPLYTSYISSPNHCLLFTAYAHTITTCFAVVLRLCDLIPVSLQVAVV